MDYKHYKSIDFLIAWNYYKTRDTGDLRYLLKLDDYEYLPDLSNDELKSLDLAMDDINMQAAEIDYKYSRRVEVMHDLTKSITIMKSELQLVHNALQILALKRYEDVEADLKKLGYAIDNNKDYQEELARIFKRSTNRITKIKLKENDLEEMQKGISGKNTDIEQSVQAVSDYKGRDIDLTKITTKAWLIMSHTVINESKKKALKNG